MTMRECGCSADSQHSEMCSATPIYAELAATTNSPHLVMNELMMKMFEFPSITWYSVTMTP